MTIAALLAAYRAGRVDPSEIAEDVLARVAACDAPVWITRTDVTAVRERAAFLDGADRSLPLYGIPFAVKDNIDVAGLPTTAGCPGYARTPADDATVVRRLLDAGAICVGKTNLDQFATGLVGTRSPYGACSSVFAADRVSGGSSSGSAVAVARGDVLFALGTDTAGSGRIPAAFNGLVGCKPTRGLWSLRGVVPACASLDCVSVFTADVAGAAAVLDVLAAPDAADPWSRSAPPLTAPRRGIVGVPRDGQADPDDAAGLAAWQAAVARAAETWEVVEVDVAPLLEAAPLLYAAWVAERTADVGDVVASGPDGLDPTVAAIIAGGAAVGGAEVFAAAHRLAALRARAAGIWDRVDALLLPTAPAHPTHAEVAADPVGVNAHLGRFTNFVNLMDLAGLSVPAAPRADGLPFGVTLLAPAFHDRRLLELGAEWGGEEVDVTFPGTVELAVVGAHLSGLPLNGELTGRGARLVEATATAPEYRLFAIGGGRPGLVRVGAGGASVEAEVWELGPAALGEVLVGVPAPLGIGRVRLADGREVAGFLCEAAAASDAEDITHLGGWRAYAAA